MLDGSRSFFVLPLVLFAVGAGVTSAGEGSNKPLNAKLWDLDGGRVQLAELRGSPVLLELWATWCQPCRLQAEVVEGLAETFDERGVAVYAVNVGEERQKIDEHLEREPSANPVLLDRLQTISTRLELVELPALVLLDANGVVAATAVGLTGREKVLTMLDRLNLPAVEQAAHLGIGDPVQVRSRQAAFPFDTFAIKQPG